MSHYLLLLQSVNTPTAETDTATRGLRSVMEKILDTRHVTHIFQGTHSIQLFVDIHEVLC